MKVNQSIEVSVDYRTTASELLKALKGVPGHARVSVNATQGDRPWESGTKSIEISWTEQR